MASLSRCIKLMSNCTNILTSFIIVVIYLQFVHRVGASADVAALPDETSEDMSKETNPVVDVVMQMFGHTKAKFTDMIDKITKLVNHLFNLQPSSSCTSAADTVGDLFEAKLRAAFMLTVVVLLTVVMSRPYRAS